MEVEFPQLTKATPTLVCWMEFKFVRMVRSSSDKRAAQYPEQFALTPRV